MPGEARISRRRGGTTEAAAPQAGEEVRLDMEQKNVQQPGLARPSTGGRTLISDLQRMGQRLPQHGHMLH